LNLLKQGIPVFLKGSPGTGKSRVTKEVAQALGYAPDEIFGPVNVGSDTEESNIIIRREFDGQKTSLVPEVVEKWARKEKAILIIDEANLPNPAIWNYVRGLSTPERVVIFRPMSCSRSHAVFVRSGCSPGNLSIVCQSQGFCQVGWLVSGRRN
jgi:hypothetical protein